MMFDAAARKDHSKLDCLAVAILTHGGGRGMLYGTDAGVGGTSCGMISTDRLLEPLKHCKSLFGKPKLVFIQV